jgi:hypothetical protein
LLPLFPFAKNFSQPRNQITNDASLDWSDSGSGILHGTCKNCCNRSGQDFSHHNGLPPLFDNVIINFDSMSPKIPTLDLVIACLLNKEVQQITTAPLLKEDDQIKMELDKAMAVSCAKVILEVLCFFCDAKGHYKFDCPE